MVTKNNIHEWIQRATEDHTHMLIVCDTFNFDDYPVYVSEKENIHEVYEHYNGHNMQKVMEVYDLTGSVDIEKQLNESRAFHF